MTPCPISNMKTLRTAVLLLSLALVSTAQAAVFPDVPGGFIYQEEIEMLVNAQVINGNPDGNFYPGRSVNRAEMLKMLYKAKGKSPDPSSHSCFPDVESGSWYEQFVCDAAANRYVQGYADGAFKPDSPVSRVEALKMIAEVFGIEIEEITERSREIVKFVDVSTAAWYTKYLYAAFEKGILPIAGQAGARFSPNSPLLRGEAAAYIFNALQVQIAEEREEAEAEAALEGRESGDLAEETVEEDSAVQEIAFPFNAGGKFIGKKVKAYRFSIPGKKVVLFTASLQSAGIGKINCRLYKMETDGFSSEYYFGFQSEYRCYILAALEQGEYQIELQPALKDVTYSVSAEESTGDGNDGFGEAKEFTIGLTKTDVLQENDLQDFYKFTLDSEKNLRLDASNSAEIACIIYAMEDVDLFGFTGPQCNQNYTYPAGTYFISIGRKAPKASMQTYTVQLR